MEGSDEEAADRKYQKTDSGSAKGKYLLFQMMKVVALMTIHLNQKKIYMSKQN